MCYNFPSIVVLPKKSLPARVVVLRCVLHIQLHNYDLRKVLHPSEVGFKNSSPPSSRVLAETNACCTEPPRVEVLLLLSNGIAQYTPSWVAHPVMCASKGKLCTSIQRRVHYCSWSILCPIGRSWRALEQCKISTCSGYWQLALSVIRMIGRGGWRRVYIWSNYKGQLRPIVLIKYKLLTIGNCVFP